MKLHKIPFKIIPLMSFQLVKNSCLNNKLKSITEMLRVCQFPAYT